MRCPKCNSNVYSHHQKINKSGTEIKRDYACRKCKYVFETIEQIIEKGKSNTFILFRMNRGVRNEAHKN